jgi:uncharacterized protein with PIN domain
MSTKLKTISEHNAEVLRRAKLKSNNQPNVACPYCGKALIFADGMILASLPPQRKVLCSSCGAETYILVD